MTKTALKIGNWELLKLDKEKREITLLVHVHGFVPEDRKHVEAYLRLQGIYAMKYLKKEGFIEPHNPDAVNEQPWGIRHNCAFHP